MARGELDGFLDAGSALAGELRFADTFRIEGKVSGRIVSPGELIIGERAEVEADIEVGRLLVCGRLRGRAVAERIELAAGSRVEAELVTPALVVAPGAHLRVRCEAGPGTAVEAQEPPAAARQRG